MIRRSPIVLVTALALYAGSLVVAQTCLYYPVSQYDWVSKRGFYTVVQGCDVADASVALGVSDGLEWRAVEWQEPLRLGHDYTIRAVVGPESAELYVDGELVGVSEGRFAPYEAPLLGALHAPWGKDLGDYIVSQELAWSELERDGEVIASVRREMDRASEAQMALRVFNPPAPVEFDIQPMPGDTITAEAVVRLNSFDMVALAPYIDRYGQHIAADWPGKVTSDQQLIDDVADEAKRLAKMPPPEGYDAYGGYTKSGWTSEATGFFRVEKRDGMWWLITPVGTPCFYLGICAVPGASQKGTPTTGREFIFEDLPPKTGAFAESWMQEMWGGWDGSEYVSFRIANLARKYGDDWREASTQNCFDRIRAWGFHQAGKWNHPKPVGMPRVPVLWEWDTPRVAGHMDPWNAEVVASLKSKLEPQMIDHLDDPMILGWSFQNELEYIKPEEIDAIMKLGPDVPAKRALVDHLVETVFDGSTEDAAAGWDIEADAIYAAQPELTDEQTESCRQHYEDAYYAMLYRVFREIDPNHMYLGNWVAFEWWENEMDWTIMARHCDLLGYDRYDREYDSDRIQRLQGQIDKPVICGEYGFALWYEGARGYGRYADKYATSDAEAGEFYYNWMRNAATDPMCVGMMWFIYEDQEITGRGPGSGPKAVLGQNLAFGAVDITDRPRWEIVTRMREINLQVHDLRLEASK
ncbi:MAG TPA: glycosyl hydrolase [Armatimonadota bacterium]|nr:glycosyl hydrolase [Armatimonadota bacterium]